MLLHSTIYIDLDVFYLSPVLIKSGDFMDSVYLYAFKFAFQTLVVG